MPCIWVLTRTWDQHGPPSVKQQKIVPDFIKEIVHFTNKSLVLLFKLEKREKEMTLKNFKFNFTEVSLK